VAAKNNAGYGQPISLAQCPFCGGNGRIRESMFRGFTVQCEVCGTVQGKRRVMECDEAVSIWNTRCIVTLRGVTVDIRRDDKPASAGEG